MFLERTINSTITHSLQGTGSEPLGLGPSFPVENRNSLACLPGKQTKEKIETLLLASEMPLRSRTVRLRGMETGISEASKRVSIFPLPPREASK